MVAETVLSFMDSYLIKHGEKKQIYITSLEIPISLSNQKLGVKSYDLLGDFLVLSGVQPNIFGFHVRNIFQARPSDEFVYSVDHGLDIAPFPGGEVLKYNLNTKSVKGYDEFQGKFNFGGDAFFHRGTKYEVFVGFNFVCLFRNGVRDDRIEAVLREIGEKHGFLSATFFESKNELFLFLGVSDIFGVDLDEFQRFDYFVNLSHNPFTLIKIERSVPWNWATVWSEEDSCVPGFGKVLKVAYHNPGFSEPRIGFYQLENGFNFRNIDLGINTQFKNSWIPKFEFTKSASLAIYVVALLRSGPGGEVAGFAKIELSSRLPPKFDDLYLVGLHKIEDQLFGISVDLRLLKI